MPNQPRYSTLDKTDDRRILASIEGGLKSGPAEPMPEDPKGQAVSAFRRIGFVFRVILYGGLGLGLTATLGFFGLHLWVEYLELPPPTQHARAIKDQDFGWDDQIEGWGGAHLGKGTDPRLGWRIRALIRAAWVAENWQSGQLAIDSEQSRHIPNGHLVDSAYAISESRLQQAIFMAKEAGLKLEDRTLFELQLRLAHICERINTPLSLMKSYEIYSQLWRSCVGSIDRFGANQNNSGDWEARQAIRIANNLGQVGLKMAALKRAVDESQADVHRQAAENYLIWAITRGLGIRSNLDHAAELQSTVPPKLSKPSVWSAVFGNPDRQTENATGLSLSKSTLDTHLQPITQQLKILSDLPNPSELEFTPAQLRLTISSLMNLSVHLVSVDIQKAFTFQNQIHKFVHSAVETQGILMNESPDGKLHYHWLRSRAALSLVYLSEIGEAVKQMTDQSIVDRCQNALEIADFTLSTLEDESDSSEVFQPGTTRSFSGRLSEPLETLKRDLRLTGAMGANFLGLKYETCPSKSSLAQSLHLQSTFKWCYPSNSQAQTGCELAKKFFQRAVDYSLGHSVSQSRHQQPVVLLNPLNENLSHLARIDHPSQNS